MIWSRLVEKILVFVGDSRPTLVLVIEEPVGEIGACDCGA
jgi:hypothetical protein